MGYTLGYELHKFTSPVVINFEGEDAEYANGKIAGEVTFDKQVIVVSVKASDNKIIVNVVENTNWQNADWMDRDVSLFDGD